jgi:hypothetical protein
MYQTLWYYSIQTENAIVHPWDRWYRQGRTPDWNEGGTLLVNQARLRLM